LAALSWSKTRVNDNKSTVNTPEENATAAAVAHANGNAPFTNNGATGAADAKTAADTLARRVIKRYSNRKLYDTQDSRYVTLLQIAEMVRGGEEVQIIDNNSKEDLTEVTLAQIIYEEQKAHSRSVPLQTLKELIHQRTEKVLTELREGPIGRLLPGSRDANGEHEGAEHDAAGSHAHPPASQSSRNVAAEPWAELTAEIRKLRERVEQLETRLNSTKS
jgi:polyhydroxyalkanoate synthesis repressor PhaR